MRRPPFPPLIILWCLIWGASVPADDLEVGVEDLPYLPFYSVDRGQYRGYARELLDAFATARSHRIHYRPLPVERLYRELFDGGIDFKFPDNPDWRHELKQGRSLHYSRAIAPFMDGVMVLPQKIKTQSRPLKIGTIRGFTPWPLLELIEQGDMLVSENNSIPGLLRQCLAGRLDGVFINADVARFHLANVLRRDDALTLDESLPHARSAYNVSTINRPDIIEELDGWLAENQELVTALRTKWGIRE
jgi:polar amino acid transport system substrate-binding protein